MRKPRPQDFDPGYKASGKPKPEEIDISGTIPIKPRINNEEHVEPIRTEMRTENSTEEQTEFRSEFRSVKLPVKRRTKRYSFEFYDDQIQQIRMLKIKTEMNGESIAMSEIVRQAIDQYLKNK